jgi:hypothetical protein
MTAAERETDYRRYNFLRIWQKRYAHMKARHEGRSTNYSHCQGKGLMSREEFFRWCKDFKNLDVFLTLYFEWASADFPLHLSPSIDRVDPDGGYVDGNIQWMSFADNCEKNHKDPITHKELHYESASV